VADLSKNELCRYLEIIVQYSTVVNSLFTVCDPAAVRTSRTNSPKLPHRPKPDVNTLGNLSWRSAGGPGRDPSTLMELQLNKVLCVYLMSYYFDSHL